MDDEGGKVGSRANAASRNDWQQRKGSTWGQPSGDNWLWSDWNQRKGRGGGGTGAPPSSLSSGASGDPLFGNKAAELRQMALAKGVLQGVDFNDTSSPDCLSEKVKDLQREGGTFGTEQWYNFCWDYHRGTSFADSKDPGRVPNLRIRDFFEEIERSGCWSSPQLSWRQA